MKSYHNQRKIALIFRYVLLAILAVLWIFPIIWIILASFSYNNTGFVSTIWPDKFTWQNYIGIFTNSQYPFVNWVLNTLFVAVISATLSTFVTIAVAYVLSRLRFRFRKPFLQIALVLGMFPGFMSMIALYYILKALNMLNLGGLILVYVGGAGLGFYIAKGFFDTMPRAIDEAAEIDGATKSSIYSYWIATFKTNDRLYRTYFIHGSMGRLHFLRYYPLYLWKSEDLHGCVWFIQHGPLIKRYDGSILYSIHCWLCGYRYSNYNFIHCNAEVLR